MALTSGFFISKDGDRKYNAEEFGSIFDGIITDGVIGSIGNKFLVTSEQKSNDFRVYVGTGRAWFIHTWVKNDSRYAVTISDPEVQLDRIDAVVLDINRELDYRQTTIKVIKGTPGRNPVKPGGFSNTPTHKQVPLAFVRVRSGSTYIRSADIENAVGTSSCPLAIGVLKSITVDELLRQWDAEFTDWMNNTCEHNYIAWTNWFSHIQYELDGDVAGHLQRQIDEIKKFTNIYFVDSVLYLPMSAASISGKKLIFAT